MEETWSLVLVTVGTNSAVSAQSALCSVHVERSLALERRWRRSITNSGTGLTWENPSLEVSTNPLGLSGMSVTDTDSYSFSRHRKICLYEAKEGVVNIPFSVNGVLSPATDPVPHTMVPPSQSPL